METTITQDMIEEIRKTINVQAGHEPADAEFELCFQRATQGWDNKTDLAKLILQELHAIREPFMNGSITHSTAGWMEIVRRSNEGARHELLAGSVEIQTLDKLQAEATEAQRKAKAKSDELERAFSEFSSIPTLAAAEQERLNRVKATRERLSLDRLNAELKEAARSAFDADYLTNPRINEVSMLLASRAMRLVVCDDVEREACAVLNELRAKNIALAKKLGQARHSL
jgi:hypothetical protein